MTAAAIDDPDDVPNVEKGDNDPGRVAARQAEATRLRAAGLTYAQIAQQMGYTSARAVQRLVMNAASRKTAANLDELRVLANERFDFQRRMLTEIVSRKTADGKAYAVSDSVRIRAIEAYTRVEARAAAINGLDAPVSSAVMGRAQAALAELSELLMSSLSPGEDVVDGEVVADSEDDGPRAIEG